MHAALCVRGLRESVNVRDCELGLFRKKLSDSEDELGATLKHRDATSRENSQLRDELDKARIDNQVRVSHRHTQILTYTQMHTCSQQASVVLQALHLKVDDCSQEMENLQRRVQEYADDITRIEDLLASKVASNLPACQICSHLSSLLQDTNILECVLHLIQCVNVELYVWKLIYICPPM